MAVILVLTAMLGVRLTVKATNREVTLGDKILFALAAFSCLLFVSTSLL